MLGKSHVFGVFTPAILAAAALALLAAPAGATVPALSGKYAVADVSICQAVQSGSNPGLLGSLIETTHFDPSTGMVKITGAAIFGYLVVWSGGTTGYQTQAISQTKTYSNTANTLTIGSTTYNIIYGHVKKGIAQSAAVNGIDSNGCVATVTAIHE